MKGFRSDILAICYILEVPVVFVGPNGFFAVDFGEFVDILFVRDEISYFKTDQVLEIDIHEEGRDNSSQKHFLEKDSCDGPSPELVLNLKVLFYDIGSELEERAWVKSLAIKISDGSSGQVRKL